jgi:hypothetical protein
MTTKHTPGPWLYHIEPGSTHAAIVDIDGTHIVDLLTIENSTAHSSLNNNARLIAAAPDLLHALRLMLREHDALQMAEGSTHDRWAAATLARAVLNKLGD